MKEEYMAREMPVPGGKDPRFKREYMEKVVAQIFDNLDKKKTGRLYKLSKDFLNGVERQLGPVKIATPSAATNFSGGKP